MRRLILCILAACVLPFALLSKGTPLPGSGGKATLEAFLPEGADSGTAVIVCPGGSYFWLDDRTEGVDVAQWLARNGIFAYLLRYRVSGWFAFVHHFPYQTFPGSLKDLQSAMREVRAQHPGLVRLGLMGFSAGGHLVMSAAEFYGDEGELRPDFVAPVYPVVTFSDERYVHKRSRRALLGDKGARDRTRCDALSLERHVRVDGPPVFLLNCEDDPVVDWHNSALLDSALSASRIPHLYTRYRTGGHGFGAAAAKQNAQTRGWQNLFMDWLNTL